MRSHVEGVPQASKRAPSAALATTIFLLGLSALCAWVGYFVLGRLGLLLGVLAVALLVGFSAGLSPELAMRMQRGVRLTPERAPELHAAVARLSRRAGIAAPALYLVPTPTPNALSAGALGGRAALAVTSGLLELLSRDEYEAVIAHEIAHLRNRDTLLLRLAGSLLRTLQMLLRVATWVALIGLLGRMLPLSIAIGVIVLATVLPWVAAALHQALSRTREFAADETAVELTGSPEALASALQKLGRVERHWMTRALGVEDLPPWLRSHPATRERIERLRTHAGREPPGRRRAA